MARWRGVRLLAVAAGLAALVGVCPPAGAIVLGGKLVPRDKFVVYLMIGHSNMAGRDESHADGATHPRCWNYRWYADEQWVPAKEEARGRRGLTPRGSGGPGMGFLKQMAAVHSSHHFGIIINANSAASASGGDNSYKPGARLYREIVSAALAVKKDVTLGGIVCMLGCNEHGDAALAATFCDDMVATVTAMRADLGEDELPFLIGQYEAGATGGWDPRQNQGRVIIQQIYKIAKVLKNAAVVDSRGIEMCDDHHYSVRGHALWSHRAIALIHQRKWFPPPGRRAVTVPEPTTAPATRPVVVAKPVLPDEPDTWPITRNGLIFLWQNAKADNRITDPARGKPRPCKLSRHGYAIFGPDFEMDTAGGWLMAEDADDEVLFDACRQSDQLVLEATIFPHGTQQQRAHILCYGPEKGDNNFALIQDGNSLILEMKLGRYVDKPLSAELCELEPGRARHVLVSFVAGLVTCYVNGRQVATRRDIGGGFRSWSMGHLVFGDTWGGGHNWRGRIEGVAIYNRFIGSGRARDKANLYHVGLRKRAAVPRISLVGRLLAKSTPARYTGVYDRALILYRYAVQAVTEGSYPNKEIQVLHWGGLDEKKVQAILGREVGRSYELLVEPAAAHPELATEDIGVDAENIDLPRYYDVARPMPPKAP